MVLKVARIELLFLVLAELVMIIYRDHRVLQALRATF